MELRNTEHWQKNRTPAEQRNTGGTIGIPLNSEALKEQQNNGTTPRNTTDKERRYIDQIRRQKANQENEELSLEQIGKIKWKVERLHNHKNVAKLKVCF